MTDTNATCTVYFDGACPVCRREIDTVRRSLDRPDSVDFVDVSRAADQVAPDLSRAEALARFHVRRADGTLLSGAAAFVAIWRQSRWLRPLAIAIDHRPGLALADLAYRGFLALRKAWRKPGPA